MLLAAVVEIRNLGPAQFERAQKFRLVSTELAAAQPTATPPPGARFDPERARDGARSKTASRPALTLVVSCGTEPEAPGSTAAATTCALSGCFQHRETGALDLRQPCPYGTDQPIPPSNWPSELFNVDPPKKIYGLAK